MSLERDEETDRHREGTGPARRAVPRGTAAAAVAGVPAGALAAGDHRELGRE